MKKYFLLPFCFYVLKATAQSNYAVTFDGADDYISVPHNASLNVSDFTFEAWINLSNTSTPLTILSKGDGSNGTTTNYVFNVGGSTGNGRLGLFAGGSWYAGATTLTTNKWYHVAVTVSAGSVTFYLNGISDGTATLSGSIFNGGSYLFKIGEQGDGCNCNLMNGKIDEVRVWNLARTAAEIKANLFNKNLSNSTNGLVAYYTLNEGGGTNAANICTNTTGIDGTLTNGPLWSASPIQYGANALAFNGSNYAELGNRINLGSSDFTFEAWVYPKSTAAGMVIAQDVCGNAEQQFRFYTNNNKINFDFSDAAALGASYSFQLPSTANSVPLNTWTHAAIVRSGNNYNLYINGQLNATYSTGTNTINNQSGADVNKRYRIGARGGVSTGCGLNYFNGSLDEIRYWNVARTGTEIQQNYFNEIDPATNSNLVGYYTMNQGIPSGNNTSLLTLYDQKGNNNGTLNGFSLSGSTSNFIAQSNNLTILPLKWLSFIAQKQISSVLLKWSTVSESHTSDFSIEHSADGRNWKNIGLVSSINNMEPHSYSYVHTAPSAGYNFYRIRQNDKDGKYSYSIIVHVDFGKTSVPFTLISNPVMNKTLQLRVNSSVNQSITLLGGEGKIIWKKEFPAGIYAIDMNMLPKGIYILKAEGYSEKLILQ